MGLNHSGFGGKLFRMDFFVELWGEVLIDMRSPHL